MTVAVPSIGSLGSGARPFAKLLIGFGGEDLKLTAGAGAIIAAFTLPELLPQASGTVDALRAYFCDARGLNISAGTSRAATAFAGCEKQQSQQLPADVRQRFHLLTDPPVPASAGTTRLAATSEIVAVSILPSR
ncbi:hypothetical protein ACT009_08480 [Sphingomonas sp. Tas61C01]|uniref:hypothetical protein n=1 Tax=Sphingomonas sp. Tas61C01 TaxID=3458297 RepID=UPI00403E823C